MLDHPQGGGILDIVRNFQQHGLGLRCGELAIVGDGGRPAELVRHPARAFRAAGGDAAKHDAPGFEHRGEPPPGHPPRADHSQPQRLGHAQRDSWRTA